MTPINFTIAYSPANPIFNELVTKAATQLQLNVTSLPNSLELETVVMANDLICGIVFDDSLKDITKLPNDLTYSIRFPSELRAFPLELEQFAAFQGNWRTEVLFDQFLGNSPRNLKQNDGGTPAGYTREGFLQIQNAIERSFIMLTSGANVDIPEVSIQRYPYPAFTLDPVLAAIEIFLPILMILSFLFVSINTIKVSWSIAFDRNRPYLIKSSFTVHHS